MMSVTSDFPANLEPVVGKFNRHTRMSSLPTYNSAFENDIKTLIEYITKELNSKAGPVTYPNAWTFTQLYLKARDLLQYRSFLSYLQIHQDDLDVNYIDFISNAKQPIPRLLIKNPFILFEHLIRVFNQFSQSNPDVKQEQLPQFYSITQRIDNAASSIEAGLFGTFIKSLSQYTLGIMSSTDQGTHMLKASEFANELNMALSCRDSFSTSGDPELDFYTLQMGIFKRIPFENLEDYKEYLTAQSLTSNQIVTQALSCRFTI